MDAVAFNEAGNQITLTKWSTAPPNAQEMSENSDTSLPPSDLRGTSVEGFFPRFSRYFLSR
jgi:hypothetical protein